MGGKQRSTKTVAWRGAQWESTAQPECSQGFARVEGRAQLAAACARVPEAPATASPQLLRARELLKTLPKNREAFIRHLKTMREEDPVEGPLNLHWCLSKLAQVLPHGTGRSYFLQVAETSLREGLAMRKLRTGWAMFGEELGRPMTPWDVVHHRPEQSLPRYCSEPNLHHVAHIP